MNLVDVGLAGDAAHRVPAFLQLLPVTSERLNLQPMTFQLSKLENGGPVL